MYHEIKILVASRGTGRVGQQESDWEVEKVALLCVCVSESCKGAGVGGDT
jgi:hypothetical protein